MKPPEQGDRVRFAAQDEIVEGVVDHVSVLLGLLHVCDDDDTLWLVGLGDVLVVEP